MLKANINIIFLTQGCYFINSKKYKKLCFLFRCEYKHVKINVNSPQEKLVSYFPVSAKLFTQLISDTQFLICQNISQ